MNLSYHISPLGTSPCKLETSSFDDKNLYTGGYKLSHIGIPDRILSGAFTRNIQDLVMETYGVKRSIGYISELINEKGRKAKEVLEGID